MYVCMYVCMYICMCVRKRLYGLTYAGLYITRKSSCTVFLYACACAYLCMYVYVCFYECMYVCMYACIYHVRGIVPSRAESQRPSSRFTNIVLAYSHYKYTAFIHTYKQMRYKYLKGL